MSQPDSPMSVSADRPARPGFWKRLSNRIDAAMDEETFGGYSCAAADRPVENRPITESCWTCGAPVVRTKGADNGLRGAEKIASADTFTYAPPAVENSELREALDGFQKQIVEEEYCAPQFEVEYEDFIASARSRIEELFAASQAKECKCPPKA